MNLYFITGNTGKFEEVKSLIPFLQQKDIDLPEIQELDPQKIITAKLQEAQKHVQGGVIVEDTSLYFSGLNGLPGPLIKWFLKSIGNEGLFKLTSHLKNNKAIAKTVIGFAKNHTEVQFFEGEINGNIVRPKGDKGFGWDPLFLPDGSNKTFGEMTLDEKMHYSMRKIAALKLKKHLAAKATMFHTAA